MLKTITAHHGENYATYLRVCDHPHFYHTSVFLAFNFLIPCFFVFQFPVMKCKLCSVRRVVKRRYLLRHVVSLLSNYQRTLKFLKTRNVWMVFYIIVFFTGRGNLFRRSSSHVTGVPITKRQRQILWSCVTATRYTSQFITAHFIYYVAKAICNSWLEQDLNSHLRDSNTPKFYCSGKF